MCKYCKIRTIESFPQRTNVDDGENKLFGVIALREDGGKELVIQARGIGAFGLQIKYCPMCGEEL